MRGYARVASVGFLMMGLLAVPSLSPATDRDGNGRHSLLNTELRSKIERLRDKIEDHRERHHNQEGMPGYVQVLQSELATLKTALATANQEISRLSTRLGTLETSGGGGGTTNPVLTELARYVSVNPGVVNGLRGPHVIFHHVNVHVQSGSGTTVEAGAPTGLGNLIVGYDEIPAMQGWSRNGSHNLVVGPAHSYASSGGAVFGMNNLISGHFATILGGNQNVAGGQAASILGGYQLTVNGVEETYP